MVARRLPFCPLLQALHRARRMGLWTEMKPLLRDRLFPGRVASTKERHSSSTALFQMATGYWLSQAIYVAAKLGIADLLKDRPQSYVALAVATGSDAPSLFRLLRALSSVGIFSQLGKDCFALSRLAESLRADTPVSLRKMVITIGEIHYQACGNLLHSVQTGSSAFLKTFGTSLFEYLRQNVDAGDAFHQGMANVASMLAYAVLMSYDFAEISSIVDIGGGRGTLLGEDSAVQSRHERYGFRHRRDDRRSNAATWQQRMGQSLLIRFRRFLHFGSTRSSRLPAEWRDPRLG
jgi:O-methyltransferase domain/Dimerisation domain